MTASAIIEEYRYGRGFSYQKFMQDTHHFDRLFLPLIVPLPAYLHFAAVFYGVAPLLSFATAAWAIITVGSAYAVLHYLQGFWRPRESRTYGTIPRGPYLLEIDRYPDASEGEYHREFLPVAADSLEDAIGRVCEGEEIGRDQVLHGRKLEHTELDVNGIGFEGASVWVDDSREPNRAYSMSQYGKGFSSYYVGADGYDMIHHSVAGYSNHPAVKFNERTYSEIVAHHEIHELVHWALEHDEQPISPEEESEWHGVLWGVQDYIQEEQPDGPWFRDERRLRIELTRP